MNSYWIYHKYFFPEILYNFKPCSTKNCRKFVKYFWLANIKNKLLPAFMLKFVQLLNEKKFRKTILCDSFAFAKLFFCLWKVFWNRPWVAHFFNLGFLLLTLTILWLPSIFNRSAYKHQTLIFDSEYPFLLVCVFYFKSYYSNFP